MKKTLFLFSIATVMLASCSQKIDERTWIRINQMGYYPEATKTAVFITKGDAEIKQFSICDSASGKILKNYNNDNILQTGEWSVFKHSARLNFSDFSDEGTYYISANNIKSDYFRIAYNLYEGASDFLLKYMRQQRCGFNPYINAKCHQNDGFIIYHPTMEGKMIDATGGWHDAADQLQYVTTSANAVYTMLLAYQHNPEVWTDKYDALGLQGANGIPDILDEAKWGMDWLVKMNPQKNMMFAQIADDRDHKGFRIPSHDSVDYGKGANIRPVYYVTGEPQGLFQHKNKTKGVSSIAGKFASAFALGSQILKPYYPEYSENIAKKAVEAYEYGKLKPGATPTAPGTAPYHYEEENYVDDMELAASELATVTGNAKYIDDAAKYGRQEPVIPWILNDTARHYQWYPFVNTGHYRVAESGNKDYKTEFVKYMKEAIDIVAERAKQNPFNIGIPFIWCSNNYVAAMLTHIELYKKLSGDNTYDELESSLLDWLFGCNPWGTGMICGLPAWGDTPEDVHAIYNNLMNGKIDGGLIDGPVRASIFNSLQGVEMSEPDEYAEMQPVDKFVYHDDHGDFSTNEPTMDGVGFLTYYLSTVEKRGKK
ncbi:MAG: glycoside hydrolase family 9 protein [Prevotellaceae bacterium]|jgi:hypothetical protein|nr:glycoside hydrolase family 9 protein [Prevotellaceae bacterium]